MRSLHIQQLNAILNMNRQKICAEQTFRHMGYGLTRENVEQDSILGGAFQHPLLDGNSKYYFTENYFYHEFMFYWFSAIEMEAYNNFISKVKALCEVDFGPLPLNAQSILQEMQSYALLIPKARMKEVGIIPEFPLGQFEDWYSNRVDTVMLLLREATATGIQAIPNKQSWSAGLAPRSTPYHHYLGAFSDAMIEAVGGESDVLFSTAFETTILIMRQVMFGRMQQMLDEDLAQAGVQF